MLPAGYVAVVTHRSRVAHLQREDTGWLVCPNSRWMARNGTSFWPDDASYPLCARCVRLHRRPTVARTGRAPAAYSTLMREILSDGEWHEIRDLALRGGTKVPPNKAMAWFQDCIAPLRSPQWSEQMSTREKIRRGRFGVAERAIVHWLSAGFVEADRPPRRKGRRVRLTERKMISVRDEKGRIRGWK